MGWLEVLQTVLFYIFYPIILFVKLSALVLYILATPFIAIGRLIAWLIAIPWRIAAQLEVLDGPPLSPEKLTHV